MAERNRLAPLVLLGDLVFPSIAWGVSLTLVVESWMALHRRASKMKKTPRKLVWQRIYLGVVFLLATVQLAASIGAKSEQENPSMGAFNDIEFERIRCPGIKSVVNVMFVVMLLLTDGLLVSFVRNIFTCSVLISLYSYGDAGYYMARVHDR
jgi:hypothetical protein